MDEIKSKVLKELMAFADEKMMGKLKSKSPKFMKVETNDPEMAEEVVEGAMDKSMPEPMKESMPGESCEMGQDSQSNESENSDDLQRLMDMYNKLK